MTTGTIGRLGDVSKLGLLRTQQRDNQCRVLLSSRNLSPFFPRSPQRRWPQENFKIDLFAIAVEKLSSRRRRKKNCNASTSEWNE